ncbi:MAG: TIGR03364 family FAD-dependent oxidoreductase [Micrococcales bacterium]|nr:TIGR03364 family FAD-dependent oxidoreductase [Micrococcales bacterium]
MVGAGITGLGHALAAIERGLTVTVLERDARAVGASVRNFGHACVTAQTGELLELALSARTVWLRAAAAAGFTARETGGLAVARSAAELAVLEELAGARGEQVRMLTGDAVRARLGGGDPAILGGGALRDDLRIDPRAAVAALAAWLETQPGVRILWRTSYLGSEDGVVRTSRGRVRARHVIVCAGHDLDLLHPELADAHEVRRCALQMALVAPPREHRIEPAVLTGTSMLRYPAFAETRAAGALRAELTERRPDLVGIGANVMFTQRPDGSLIVGDSHAYDLAHPPFLDETTSQTLLAEIARILDVPGLRVLQRWQGVYASSARQPFLVAHPQPGLTVVTISSGVGMTIALGLAQRVLDELGAGTLAASGA